MKKQLIFTLSYLVLTIPLSEITATKKVTELNPVILNNHLKCKSNDDHNPERIYHVVDNDMCAEWEVTKKLSIAYNYEQAKDLKEDGVFYYYDDDNELIQTQNYLANGQVVIKFLFWHQNVCHIISLICCKENLIKNKKVLKSIHQRILSGQL